MGQADARLRRGTGVGHAALTPPVRDAATIILIRRDGRDARILMGRRGARAAFMPDRFVFPGGAVDPDDSRVDAPAADLETARDLGIDTTARTARALPLSAIRELREETGLTLGRPDPDAPARAAEAPVAWRDFLSAGLAPRTDALRLIFRAVTPAGRPRRFDARFFTADAEGLAGDPDDFARADAELSDLRWFGIAEARALKLPFITGIVLAELAARLAAPEVPRGIPYFRHDAQGSHFRML